MAVTITPLGFKKPDGGELARGGDDILRDNAQTAEDVIAAVRGRLDTAEGALAAGPTPDPDNPGLYFVA